MQIQCTDDFSDREGGRTRRRKAGAVSDADSMPARPSPRRGCGQHSATAPWPGQRPAPPLHCVKNPARPSAPTRQARQRIKPSLCRPGIQSEQTSETHQLAAARPAVGSDPVAARCSSQRRLARAYEVQARASRRRFRCRFNARAVFRIARAAEVRCRKAGAVSDADSMQLRPSPRRGCGQHSATTSWPGQRPALPVHHAKKIQRGSRRPRARRANG